MTSPVHVHGSIRDTFFFQLGLSGVHRARVTGITVIPLALAFVRNMGKNEERDEDSKTSYLPRANQSNPAKKS